MSQVIRSEDLEAGVMFEVAALGTVPLGQTSSMTDVVALQKPIRDLYLNYQKPTGAQPLPSCRLVVSNRGLAVTEAPTGPQDRTPSAETLYNIPSVVFAAAVRFLVVGKKERDFRCAFEAIDSDGPPVSLPKGKNDLYVPFDKKWKYLAKVTSHPAICACVIQRMTGVRALELHAFVCESDVQARDVIFCLTSALKNFTTREAQSSANIYGHGPYDLPPQMGGMRNEAEHLMVQQQTRPPGSGEGVYGFQGQQPDQMMAYRGADAMAKPGGMRPDLGGPVGGGGGMWDPRTQDGRPPLGSGSDGQQGSDWLSNQRDQLMRNFANDQRKNEPLRNQAEQGIYDQQQRGVYDIQPPRIVYDPPPSSRGVYDSQPSKGIYDAPSAIYEYRAPQSHPEPTGGIYAAGPPQPSADPYTLRRDIYDPQLANRVQLEPGTGNLYGPMRAMSGSSERLFDEPRRGGQDLQKSNYDAPPRQTGGGESYGGPAESDYGKGFALPRAKVNYDGDAPPSGGGEYGSRPSSFSGYDSGNMQKPPGSTSSPYPSVDRRSPVPQVKAKVQPPAPLAKNPRPSATSPTTESNPGLRPTGGGGSMPPRQEWVDAPIQQSVPVAPKKVMGIKVFPTIMLRGNQAAAAAAAAEEDGEDRDPVYASHPVDNLRSTKPNGAGPERQPANRNVDDHRGQDRRKKDDEMESAFGGLTVDPGRSGRNAANDFEQSLGYLP